MKDVLKKMVGSYLGIGLAAVLVGYLCYYTNGDVLGSKMFYAVMALIFGLLMGAISAHQNNPYIALLGGRTSPLKLLSFLLLTWG